MVALVLAMAAVLHPSLTITISMRRYLMKILSRNSWSFAKACLRKYPNGLNWLFESDAVSIPAKWALLQGFVDYFVEKELFETYHKVPTG